jgi:hypothetical protein
MQTYLPHLRLLELIIHIFTLSALRVSGQLRVLTVSLALWILAFHPIPRISSTR